MRKIVGHFSVPWTGLRPPYQRLTKHISPAALASKSLRKRIQGNQLPGSTAVMAPILGDHQPSDIIYRHPRFSRGIFTTSKDTIMGDEGTMGRAADFVAGDEEYTPVASSVTIFIEDAKLGSFGETLSDIRTWLDHQKIQPIDFRPIEVTEGVGFEVRFRSQDEAQLFEKAFGPRAPPRLANTS